MNLIRKLTRVNTIFALCCAVVAAWFMTAWSHHEFSNDGFMPHGHCYLWTPTLVWTMVTTDLLIGLAYVSISICLYVLVRKIQLPFSAMFLAFGLFIAACGTTHFMEVYTLWYPNYWLAAFVKVITAIASVATAVIMFPLFPRVIQFADAARLSEDRRIQLEKLNQELLIKTEALTRLNQELESFSYSVSHDLRTPLRGIDGFSQALNEDYASRLDDQGREYLTFIRTGAQRMGKIIDDLLDLSRMARVEVRRQKFNLTLVAEETIQTLKAAAELGHAKSAVVVEIQKEMTVNGDANLLRLVLENLLSNAWKFTSKIQIPKIEVGQIASGTEGKSPTYFVRDNGVGFDMAYSAKLFAAFQRLHTFEDYAGNGIGLATTKRIIERHGGAIWAESQIGVGTTFFFTIGG